MTPLFSYGFLLLGGGVAAYGRWRAMLAERSLTWPRTTGRVTRSAVVATGRGPNRHGYEARVEYDYAVDGVSYHGKTLSIGGHIGNTRGSQQERCDRYPVGADVTVYYDPDKPARCTIERDAAGASFMSMVGIAFAVFGILGAVGIVG